MTAPLKIVRSGESAGNGYRPSFAAVLLAEDEPIMKAAADAMGATPDELLKWVETKRYEGLDDDAIRVLARAYGDTQAELEGPPDESENALIIKPVNAFMEDAARDVVPKRLMGDLEFEGDLILVFGDTGVNKTVHAIQGCEQVSRARNMLGLECELEDGLETTFFDFELSKKQLEKRYSNNWQDHYLFSEKFYRAEFNRNCRLPEGLDFERFVLNSVEASIAEKGTKYAVLDNKAAIRAATEKSHDAGHFMNELNRIKAKYGVTLKLTCHTPKRDPSRPLSINDLAGSKVLSNLADAVYGIGASHTDPSIRYIKQFKIRHDEIKYGADNVILYRVTKPSNFLGLEFLGYGVERDHLAQTPSTDQGGRRQREACEFLQRELSNGPVNSQEIKQKATDAGIAEATLRRAREALGVEIKWGAWSLPTKS